MRKRLVKVQADLIERQREQIDELQMENLSLTKTLIHKNSDLIKRNHDIVEKNKLILEMTDRISELEREVRVKTDLLVIGGAALGVKH